MEFLSNYLTPEDIGDLGDLRDLLRLGGRLSELSWGTRMVLSSTLLVVAFLSSVVLRASKRKNDAVEGAIHQCVFWGLGLGIGSVWFLSFAVVVAMKKRKFVIGVLGAVLVVVVFQWELALAWWKGVETSSGLVTMAINTISAFLF